MIKLNDIDKICDSKGGIQTILITTNDNLKSDNTIEDSSQVFTIYFRNATAKYKEKSKDSKTNQKIIQSLQAFIPKRRLPMELLIQNIINKRITVLYTTKEGVTGHLKKAKFKYNYTSGAKLSDNQGYNIEFYTEKLLYDLDYTGININLPDPGDPWSEDDPGTPIDDCCILINPTQLSYIPAQTGNSANRNEYVIGSNGVRYFIDKFGSAIPFPVFPQYFQKFTGITTNSVTITTATLPNSDFDKKITVLRNGVEQSYTSATPGEGQYKISGQEIIFSRDLENWEEIKVYFSSNT